jgi:sporulation protein YlmC with PRC-barrel domain
MMKKKSTFTALAIAAVLAFIPACASRYDQQTRSSEVVNEPWFVHQQEQQPSQTMQQRLPMDGQQLTDFEDLKNIRVQNSLGEELGSVDKLIVDTQLDRIAYAVVSTGGAWNLEGGKAVVPWNAFQFQPARDGGEQVLILNIPREQLAIAPPGDIENVLNPELGRQIHEFYGVSPYWTK